MKSLSIWLNLDLMGIIESSVRTGSHDGWLNDTFSTWVVFRVFEECLNDLWFFKILLDGQVDWNSSEGHAYGRFEQEFFIELAAGLVS